MITWPIRFFFGMMVFIILGYGIIMALEGIRNSIVLLQIELKNVQNLIRDLDK